MPASWAPRVQLKRKIFESRKDVSVKKVFRFLAICTIGTALAISASTLVSVPLFGQSPPQSVVQPSISNTPSVNVANTPTVTLEAGASVNVSSPLDGEGNPTPLVVLDAVQPYEDSCLILFSGSQFGNCVPLTGFSSTKHPRYAQTDGNQPSS
jgi:hypothetical protein